RRPPSRCGVDGHRGVHRVERNLLEQAAQIAEMADWDADLADLATGERVIAVVTGLGRQIESDGEAGLTFGEISAIERVRLLRGRMTGVGSENPRLVRQRLRVGRFAHPSSRLPCAMQHTASRAASLGASPRNRGNLGRSEALPIAALAFMLRCSIK